MNDRDGLYLNSTWVAPPAGVALTLQGNDLTKPDQLQASYSNEFQLADSLIVRDLLRNSEQLDSGEPFPYRTQTAYVIQGGEITFEGSARLSGFSGGWNVVLYEEKRTLFERLDRSIRTLDLSRYDHVRNQANIQLRFTASEGYCYPLIDYGTLSGGNLLLEDVFPAMYIHTLVRQMLHEEGYSLTGTLPDDDIFKRLILPFVQGEGKGNDQQWADDRFARVTMDLPDEVYDSPFFGGKTAYDKIQPYSIDNLPLQGFSQGKLKPFNTTTFSYICPDNMRVIVDASQQYKVRCVTGVVETILIVEKNGVEVVSEREEYHSGYNYLLARPDILNLKAKVTCQKGDVLRVRFIARRMTQTGAWYIRTLKRPESSFASFTPDLSLQTGDTWIMNRNLPDISAKNVLIAIAQIYGGTWAVNRRRKQVQFVSLSDTVANTTGMVDWSDKIDTGTEPGWVPALNPYAQSNYLKWKESDTAKAAGTDTLSYGDGLISINADTIETSVDLFELPFSASVQSLEQLTGYGNPVKIESRTVSKGEVSRNDAAPRLLLVSLAEPFQAPVQYLGMDGITLTTGSVLLKPAWFGPRPTVAMLPTTNFCLCFSKVPGLRNELCLIDRHYKGLIRVLRRMRVLTISLHLLPIDIATINFGAPVRLKRVQVGSLTLSDGQYVINKIPDWQDGKVVSVTLIGY